jgi:fido (protein-threonine AMPylation protein)
VSEDLPIYDSTLRSRLQFADLEKLKSIDVRPIWEKSDRCLEQMEGAADIARARSSVTEPSKRGLLEIHSIVFARRQGAGELRKSAPAPLYRGHDCPPPEFVGRSLDNLFNWLTAESLAEIHPIERAALVLVRIVDIWPFEFGNLTTAVVFANMFLKEAGLPPFFVLPEHVKEFNTVIAQAISIETQPLVNAIHKTIKRELETLGR